MRSFILIAAAGLVLSASPAVARTPLPQFSAQQVCKGYDTPISFNGCVEDEQQAKDYDAMAWPMLNPTQQQYCVSSAARYAGYPSQYYQTVQGLISNVMQEGELRDLQGPPQQLH